MSVSVSVIVNDKQLCMGGYQLAKKRRPRICLCVCINWPK